MITVKRYLQLLFENGIDTENQNIDIINDSQLLVNHSKVICSLII